jgi:hypothetical protein
MLPTPIGANRFKEVNMTIGEQLKSFRQFSPIGTNWQNRQFAHLEYEEQISSLLIIIVL